MERNNTKKQNNTLREKVLCSKENKSKKNEKNREKQLEDKIEIDGKLKEYFGSEDIFF
ncbi:hypothetical protein [Halarcobacter anaerophilus]|uniref:hypothetical protein n=1 Tax=Halarcobacter anaerophilus TaxID=877500 RepID=UPI0011658C59|nr:hypothetical protein [Halarcobacter anaerophilus]QDF28343.1 hypothetical protein AANAER_0852 [Halarcobacter anaerophilus]